jgi:hypothetical protein
MKFVRYDSMFHVIPPPPLVYVDQDITIADMSCFFALAHISELSVLSALI